jgi:hypothetical protein
LSLRGIAYLERMRRWLDKLSCGMRGGVANLRYDFCVCVGEETGTEPLC